MNLVTQFVLHNLLPALVAGSLVWAFVHAAVTVFRIRHGKLRLCLYLAPAVKSTLVLLAVQPVLPWPRDLFQGWAAAAVPTATVLPFFLVATGAVVIIRLALQHRARHALLESSEAVPEAGRLATALDRVMQRYAANADRIQARCRIERLPQRPALREREAGLASPAVLTDNNPTVVFPRQLVARLSDSDLEAALAHEVAHVYLRQPFNCFSAESFRLLSSVNPFAGLMAAQLHREEEKACDDVAVDILGDSDGYASMLLRAYRHTASGDGLLSDRLQYVHQLLGTPPLLSERVENLMRRDDQGTSARERGAFAAIWVVLVVVFFAG